MTGVGSSCGACKFLRRKCSSECVFAPYFCYDEAATHFAAVHKVFGASNVSKLLLHLPIRNRSDAAGTISYEALARIRDPIYGCVAHIFALQYQVANLQKEIEILINHMENHHAVCGIPEQAATYNQDEQTTLPNNPAGFITGTDHYLCEPPSYKWEEDLNFLCNFNQNPHFGGQESGILIDYDTCMGNTSATTNWDQIPLHEIASSNNINIVSQHMM